MNIVLVDVAVLNAVILYSYERLDERVDILSKFSTKNNLLRNPYSDMNIWEQIMLLRSFLACLFPFFPMFSRKWRIILYIEASWPTEAEFVVGLVMS